jgi:hypothetical protein
VDFSWVKNLADESNQKEVERLSADRRQKAEHRQEAVATTPLVEKLFLLISACSDEFNKHVNYQHLRVALGRVQKRTHGTTNADDPELAYADEASYFTFARNGWTYAVRGHNGVVEFLELPTGTGGASLHYNIFEAAIAPNRKLVATFDQASRQVVWKENGQIVDGPRIISICQEYFVDFVQKTN